MRGRIIGGISSSSSRMYICSTADILELYAIGFRTPLE